MPRFNFELVWLKLSGARWPRNGDIYELKEPKALGFVTPGKGTGGGEYPAPAGTRIIAWVIPEAIAAGATAVAAGFANHDEMASTVVPKSVRSSPAYDGYLLHVTIRELNKDFVLVGNVDNAAV